MPLPLPPPNAAITALQAPHGGLLVAQDWYDWFRRLDLLLNSLETDVGALGSQLAKAWASVNVDLGTGLPNIEESYNVTSVAVSSGPGRFLITLTTPFSSINWVPLANGLRDPGGPDIFTNIRAITAGSVDITFTDSAGNRDDPDAFYFVAFGNQ